VESKKSCHKNAAKYSKPSTQIQKLLTFKKIRLVRQYDTRPSKVRLDTCAGILEQSIWARNRVEIGLSHRPARLHSLAKSIPWNWFRGFLSVYKFGLCFNPGLPGRLLGVEHFSCPALLPEGECILWWNQREGASLVQSTIMFPPVRDILGMHCKKRFAIFPSPAGMSLTKLSLAGNNLIYPVQGEFGLWHPSWQGKIVNLFYSVVETGTARLKQMQPIMGSLNDVTQMCPFLKGWRMPSLPFHTSFKNATLPVPCQGLYWK
jgi:hypothetical protein